MPRPSAVRLVVALSVPLLFAAGAGAQASAQAPQKAATGGPPPAITSKVEGLERRDGLVPLYWDADAGRLLMEITPGPREYLYYTSLPAGVGSNPIGLDRGQVGPSRVVVFERVGPRVLLVERNYRYRALSDDAAERRAVADSFAQSVLWGFKVEAADGDRVLVDATAFFLRDAHGVADRLRETGQGRYRFDEARSVFFLSRTRGFPLNTEVETTVTLVTDEAPGPLVRQVVPSPQSITVRQHHSLVALPDLATSPYRPRALDPRVGAFEIEFHDYASPITTPIERRWIVRHHLQKKDPSAAVSEPVEPIVYYVDNGAPEPIRRALIEGASWWKDAFLAAGFRDAFEVRVLPEDADPMDVRYNMISWVHRSTRGWSYGASVEDPRTGQILKGNVTLGSLRARQDYLLGTGLVPVSAPPGPRACDLGAAPDEGYLAALDPAADPEAMALARIRQLSAHEVGHTLGFAHNFAASAYGRASVMDYPAPLVTIRDGRIDLSQAYASGIGEYDRWVARFAYAQFPEGTDEAAALDAIVSEGVAKGLLYLSDADARPAGAAHPLANLWDNGQEPVAALREALAVRRLGLAQFGLANVPDGAPLAQLETRLLPLYLHHRFQVQAAAKVVGGAYYSYAVKTAAGPSPSEVVRIVPAAEQRAALEVLLETLAPEALVVPPAVLALLPPRAFGVGGVNTEFFPGRTAPLFDSIGAATIAADLTVSALLNPQRGARLVDFHARDAGHPSLGSVYEALVARVFRSPSPAEGQAREIARAVQWLAVTRLSELASDPGAAPPVRADASKALRSIADMRPVLARDYGPTHAEAIEDEIRRFLARPAATDRRTPPLPAPPGDPIGQH
ncbi:MAG: zinc-dependent metalloprotease [Vicinamibacteraceae bacterium]|nr:zinc-dependent metalloprotease [Vicinamibacteraceae bacterium]